MCLSFLRPFTRIVRVDQLHLPDRRDLARHADEGDLGAPEALGVGEGQVVGAVGVPGARAGHELVDAGDELRHRLRAG